MRRDPSRPFYLNVWHTGAPGSLSPSPSNTVVRCRGMTVTFENGRTVEDWGGQYYVNNLGAGRAEIARDLASRSRRMSWVAPSEFVDVRVALTRDLLSVLPRRLTTPQFTCSGSDALETAIRAARKVTRRTRVLSFTQSYHGDTMTIENVSGGTLMPYGDRRPWAVHAPSPFDRWEEAGRDWSRACDLALDGVERALRRHGPRTFAALVVEPVMTGTGAVPLSPALSRALRLLCDRHGIKLIADEVVTGFGRTGRWFGSQAVGLAPDALVCAKGITGGYAPLGAAIFERAWGEALRRTGLNHGLTNAGHPLGCAAARATIRILKRERLVERAASMGRRLRAGLETLRDRHPGEIADVRGLGLLLGLQLDAAGRAASRRRARAIARIDTIVARARARGIHLLSTSDGTGLLFTPPFTVTPRQIDRLVDVLDRSFA
ncbi:MAG TPA: aminotransferase class III-fold pyridoxal phosphate-dependent enzyme [Candidatus Binatia bacterium]|nr:aminotransferase class III-fold pyridoxal phosphate-dependent enzyme [Candidatus Binatia bacterium]